MFGMIISIFGPVFSQSLAALTASEIVCGLFWGGTSRSLGLIGQTNHTTCAVFQTLTTAYASEVCPIVLRHYLTACVPPSPSHPRRSHALSIGRYINMCWGIGILLSSGVVRATLTINSDWGWRLPFVIQWVWPLPLIIGAYFAPESPWWLVRQGRHGDAERSVARLTNGELFSKDDAKRSVANMIHTTALEREMQAGTLYLQCFKGIDLRRTEIVSLPPSGTWSELTWCRR